MSANNTSAASDTRPVFVCCEIIIMSNVISHGLVNKCLIIRKKNTILCSFVFLLYFFRFTRTTYSVHVTYVASGINWNVRSRIKYSLLESRILQLV